ncbi:MAG: hypothetical protein P8076_06875 [Gammaproteobacteria bacterium]
MHSDRVPHPLPPPALRRMVAWEMLPAFEPESQPFALVSGRGGGLMVRPDRRMLFPRREQGRLPKARALKVLIRGAGVRDRRFRRRERRGGLG